MLLVTTGPRWKNTTRFFPQADYFIGEAQQIEQIRAKLSPDTKTDIDEIGVILPNDNDPDPTPIPDPYWNACGGMFAYIFGNLALEGIDILGQSQLVGYPTQFPSVTELDWNTGKPTARYWVLKILIDNFHLGDQLIETTSSNSNVFALGCLTSDNQQKILLINKVNQEVNVQITGATSGQYIYSDTTTGFNPPIVDSFTGTSITLGPWSVAVVTLDQ